MVSLEQVKLLETKVIKTIEYVRKISEENALLKEKLDSYQQRTDELEAQIKQFKEDQDLIEDGILSALDRLNQFEDTFDNQNLQEKSPDIFVNGPEESTPPPMNDTSDDSKSSNFEAPNNPEDSQTEPKSLNSELDIF